MTSMRRARPKTSRRSYGTCAAPGSWTEPYQRGRGKLPRLFDLFLLGVAAADADPQDVVSLQHVQRAGVPVAGPEGFIAEAGNLLRRPPALAGHLVRAGPGQRFPELVRGRRRRRGVNHGEADRVDERRQTIETLRGDRPRGAAHRELRLVERLTLGRFDVLAAEQLAGAGTLRRRGC